MKLSDPKYNNFSLSMYAKILLRSHLCRKHIICHSSFSFLSYCCEGIINTVKKKPNKLYPQYNTSILQ